MKVKCLLLFFFCFEISFANAAIIKGKVLDTHGEGLAFASVYIKGTTIGTTTNLEGAYTLPLNAGEYILICRYVGYKTIELNITITTDMVHDFKMEKMGNELKEVKIKSGENPAIRIIKNTIQKRKQYNIQLKQFSADAYIKGVMKLDDVNLSNSVLSMYSLLDGESNKKELNDELNNAKGIIYLSESFNTVYYKYPHRLKINVLSSRVSGSKESYGFSQPLFINLLDNNVQIVDALNPRGYLSPIADGALLSYKYYLMDTYQEDGKTISKIKIIPRRKYEPLFSGTIDIIEDEWRLHNVDLMITKEYQLDMIDTLKIKQTLISNTTNGIVIKDQSFLLKFKLMGFSITGNFVNVYSNYVFDFNAKKTFDKFQMVYDKNALSQTTHYWDSIRPVPLDTLEVADYKKKDSIEIAEKNKKDTLPKTKKSITRIFLNPYTVTLSPKTKVIFSPIIALKNIQWNTIEGLSFRYNLKTKTKINKDKVWINTAALRYGVSNQLFSFKIISKYNWGITNKKSFLLSTGKYPMQFNNNAPVNETINSIYTLLFNQNYLKIYNSNFAKMAFNYEHIKGYTLATALEYQARSSLDNTNLYSLSNRNNLFTPNYPIEKLPAQFRNHNALTIALKATYQPGRKYIKYPNRITATESNYPTFRIQLLQGIPWLNSDVNYTQWQCGMHDDMNAKRWGTFMYNWTVGGFLQNQSLFIQDYTHFNGNQIFIAEPYLSSFQLSPYYSNSNTEPLYTTLHAEHHFYGLLTNKIPLFRKLKWYLVAATNTYYVNKNNNYIEASIGLENIGFKMFRFMRLDLLGGYTNLNKPIFGMRIGLNSNLINIKAGDDE